MPLGGRRVATWRQEECHVEAGKCHVEVGGSDRWRQEGMPCGGRRVPRGGRRVATWRQEGMPRGGRRECPVEAGECHVEVGESDTWRQEGMPRGGRREPCGGRRV